MNSIFIFITDFGTNAYDITSAICNFTYVCNKGCCTDFAGKYKKT